MKIMRIAALVAVAVAAGGRVAHAQDVVWSEFDGAARACLNRGSDAEACRPLQNLAHENSLHPASVVAEEVLRLLSARPASGPDPRRARLRLVEAPKAAGASLSSASGAFPTLAEILRDEQPTSLARAELAFFQTLHGAALGVELCVIADCTSERSAVLLAVLGGGVGLTASLMAGDVLPAKSLAMNSGVLWGAFNGVLLVEALSENSNNARTGAAVLAGSQLVGLGAGWALSSHLKLSAGDVSLANAGGLWASVFFLMFTEITDLQLSSAQFSGALLTVADLGLVAGALLATQVPMSRGRVFVLDAGGVLGGLLGFAAGVLADASGDGVLTAGAVGAVAGLATAAVFTEDWDLSDAAPFSASLAPTQGGAMLLAGGRF